MRNTTHVHKNTHVDTVIFDKFRINPSVNYTCNGGCSSLIPMLVPRKCFSKKLANLFRIFDTDSQSEDRRFQRLNFVWQGCDTFGWINRKLKTELELVCFVFIRNDKPKVSLTFLQCQQNQSIEICSTYFQIRSILYVLSHNNNTAGFFQLT